MGVYNLDVEVPAPAPWLLGAFGTAGLRCFDILMHLATKPIIDSFDTGSANAREISRRAAEKMSPCEIEVDCFASGSGCNRLYE